MVGTSQGDKELAAYLLARRLAAVATARPLASTANVAAVAALVWAYGAVLPQPWTALWAGAAVVAIGARLFSSRLRRPPALEGLRRAWRSVAILAAVESLVLALGLAGVAAVAPAAGSATLWVIGGALLGAVPATHRSAPGAALFHIVSLATGLALAQWVVGGRDAWPLLAPIASLAALLAGAVVASERAFRSAARRDFRHRRSRRAIRAVLDERDAQIRGPTAPCRQPIEDRVRALALVDPLTGFANRHLFTRQLGEMLADADGATLALLRLDLDDFKAINDVHGPPFGDCLLRELGSRLKGETREGDPTARLGGASFAILVSNPGGDGMLIERAHRLLAAARAPFAIGGQVARVTASIGIARGTGSVDAAEFLRRADLALHAARAKGRDRVALFDDRIDACARERLAMELALREAVMREELVLHYQPIIALRSGATMGYEALLRWRHPEHGPIGPDEFLPIAERSGLMVEIGNWVIRRALADVADWPGGFRIALNLSPTQLRDPHLVATLDRALAASRMDPERLELEITEHVLFEDATEGAAIFARLRALGTRIALDDFGTGYSSLSYLRRFRFDRVKIDRSFVRDIETSDEAQAIVSTITRLAQALGMQTTAEGVERPAQLDLLRKLGCDEAQGFLILEPVEAERIERSRFGGGDLPAIANEIEDYRQARRAALTGAQRHR